MSLNEETMCLTIDNFDLLISNASLNLLQREPILITYTDRENIESNKDKNDEAIAEEIGKGANIYAIWSRKPNTDNWNTMYIGQRSKKKVIERIKQHLFKTPKGTQSKLENVRDALSNDFDIGISTILITPDPLRLSVEDQLIFSNTNSYHDLPWNNKSRNVSL